MIHGVMSRGCVVGSGGFIETVNGFDDGLDLGLCMAASQVTDCAAAKLHESFPTV